MDARRQRFNRKYFGPSKVEIKCNDPLDAFLGTLEIDIIKNYFCKLFSATGRNNQVFKVKLSLSKKKKLLQ